MASSRIRSRGTGFAITVEVDGVDRKVKEFRDVRAQIAREFDEIQRQAAEREVLPDARRRAGGLKVEGQSVAANLLVRRARKAPYLTSRLRGRRARAVGLLEFGGTVRKVLVPRNAKALNINGQPIAVVRTPRVYEARAFMGDAAKARLHAFGEEVRDQLVDVFADQGFQTR